MTRYIIIVMVCAAVALFDTVKRSGSIGGYFSSAVSGIAGLFALDMLPAVGTLISINLFSISVSTVFGLPGVVSMLFMQMICSV